MGEGDKSVSKRCPIHFDQHSPEHALNWPTTYRELRTQCPRSWTDSYGGFWIASRYNDVINIAQRPASITAHKGVDPDTGEVFGGVTIPPLPGIRGAPNETESPEWDNLRNFLNRRFSPAEAEKRRRRTKQIAAALLDGVIESGRLDIVEDLTSPLPGIVTTEIFGFPLNEWRLYSEPVHRLVYLTVEDPAFAEAMEGIEFFRRRVDEEVERRRKEPREDFLSHLATGTINGQPLSHVQIQEISWQILSGGVDTTTAVSSNALLYLAQHPPQRQRLIEEPQLLPRACEEFVRYFTPIHGAARNVKHDVNIDGWDFESGERIFMAYASANRDPDIFADPEELKLDRSPNRHLGFGAGMHRCMGSFLARMMFQTVLEEVLSRIPDYQIAEDKVRRYPKIGFVNGLISLPATFTPGKRVGASLA
jgi:cytochrome P450